ncbi:MAG: hypothetical protein AXW14_08565 [Alteromonas sp. Nap_26]|nr:MAG: hypothetical protein AXW14_08565 [Alteromonas sp. Nap_26]
MRKIEVIGEVFGQLIVVSEAESRTSNNRKIRFVKVECSCGKSKEVSLNALRTGKTKSCGCHRKMVTGDMSRIHGKSTTPLYYVWKTMRQRCHNPSNQNYDYYGGRGISVCSSWNDFKEFESWALANGYSKGLTIDRTDPNGNYEPSNCEWVTWKDQANNRNFRGYLSD